LSKLFEIGEIVKTHGLRGELKLKSYLSEPAKILSKADAIFLHSKNIEKGPLRMIGWEVYKNSIFLEIDGIDDLEKAESCIGFHALISTEYLEPLPEGEYYWQDLLGMTMMTEEGDILGTLTSIFPTGSNDVYVCTGQKGEILVPAIGDVITQIDPVRRVMTVRLLPGMDKPC